MPYGLETARFQGFLEVFGDPVEPSIVLLAPVGAARDPVWWFGSVLDAEEEDELPSDVPRYRGELTGGGARGRALR